VTGHGVSVNSASEPGVPDGSTTEPMKFLADKGLGLLGLLAAVAYALSRPMYEAFYAPLGLRPEDLASLFHVDSDKTVKGIERPR